MKKSLILAILTLLAAPAAIMAQSVATSKVMEVKTQSVSTIDGSLSNASRNVNRYDRQGRMIEWVQYSNDNGFNGGEFYQYDADGKLISDQTSGTKWTFAYGADGRVSVKTKHTINLQGEFEVSAYQYVGYDDEGRVLYETNRNTKGQMTDSVRYNYKDGRLITADTYMQSGPSTYSVMKRVRHYYNDAGKEIRSLQLSVYNTSETITRGNGYKYDDYNRLVADTVLAADGDPRYLTLYKYEGSATQSLGNEYFRISSDGWMKSEVRTNTYGIISEKRTPSITSASQTSKNGPVKLSVTAPEDTEGYQGYKVIVDHGEYSKLYTDPTIELNLRRGTHEIRVVSVYDDVQANTSDAVSVDVNFELPPVSGVKVRTMEYKYSWTVTVGWNAPEATNGLHLTGYRVIYPTPWGYNDETTTKNLQTTFTYAGKANINVEVHAIYSEGESDAVMLPIDLTDTSNMMTEHWHNATTTHYFGDEAEVVDHMYYLDNNNNLTRPELLATTVTYDMDGKPIFRYFADHMETNYAKLLSETTDKWNEKTKSWDKDDLVEYVYNSYNLLAEKRSKKYNSDTHTYEPIVTEELTYDDAISGTMPAVSCLYDVKNGKKELMAKKTFVHEMDAVGVQRLEIATVYDSDGEIQEIVKTYRHATVGTEVHLDSVLTYTPSMELARTARVIVDPATGLDAEYIERLANGEVVFRSVYGASKEYHSTHLAKDLAFADNKLSWTAPSRTSGLDKYILLVDDVISADIPASATEYVVNLDIPAGNHDFTIVPVYDGAEATTSAAVNGVYVATDTSITLAEAKATTITSANRNDEYTIGEKVLVTGVIGGNCFVETNGVGMMISGITAAEGDIITDIKGKLTKVSYGKNTFAATSCTVVSSGNKVTPLEVSKEEVMANAESLDARLIAIKDVTVDKAAASNGNFNMTVTAAQNNTGMNLSITGTVEYAPVVHLQGFVSVRTGAMAANSTIMVKNITVSEASAITAPSTSTEGSALYDLQGRRMKSMNAGGIYLKNGKKYINK